MSAQPDAIVVGGGIVGAAVAWYLARDGLSVTVLERGLAGGGATAGGMGHVVVLDDSDAQFALARWSRTLLTELAPELPAAVEWDPCGTLWLAEDEAQLELARTKLRYYTDRGVRAELLDAHSLAAAEPELRPGLAGALHVPDDVVIYPLALCRWLLDRARDHGARVESGVEVVALDGGGDGSGDGSGDGGRGAARVRLRGGTSHEAGVVVNAAGAWAPALSPDLDIVPRKGHLLVTDRYPRCCRHQLAELGYFRSAHTLTDASVACNIQPRRTGQLLIGSSRELVGWDASINRDVLARMLARAAAFVPRLAGLRGIRAWTAFRPATPDKLPYIGRHDEAGIWIAAGHEGLGITTALGTGRLLADLIAGRAPPIDAAPFATGRRGVAA
jgi:D-hydroxyproline dehydrogenase subunit beta